MTSLAQVAKRGSAFGTITTSIGSLKPAWSEKPNPGGLPIRRLEGFSHDGQSFEATDRFRGSFQDYLGLGNSVYKYYSPDELFTRAQEVHPGAELRITIEGTKSL